MTEVRRTSSIARRISWSWFFRSLSMLLLLDILVVALAAAGILSEEEFLAISEDLRKEESSCQRELDRLARWEDDQDQTRIIEQKVKAFLRFDHLEKSQLQQLVRRVEVDAHKHITIAFNFTDPGKGAD